MSGAARRATRAGALAVAVLAAGPFLCATAEAHFEGMVLSARGAAQGGAFVAIANDPSAVVENPGGLCGIRTLSFLSTYRRPFGVDGVDEGFLAAVVPAGPVTVGASWFHRGVDGALSEDLFSLSIARDLKRTSEDASLSIGATVELARVAVDGDVGESATAASFGAGVLLRPFAFIGLGYRIRSINEPVFDLVAGGGDTKVPRTQAAGLSYYWQDRLVVTVETHEDAAGEWRERGGFELRVENHVALRAGLDGPDATAGVGVAWRGFVLDLAMTAHDALGATYFFTVRYARPAAVRPY